MAHFAVIHSFSMLYQHPALLTPEGENVRASDPLEQSAKLRSVVDQLHRIRGRGEKVLIFTRHRARQSILAKVLEAEFDSDPDR